MTKRTADLEKKGGPAQGILPGDRTPVQNGGERGRQENEGAKRLMEGEKVNQIVL